MYGLAGHPAAKNRYPYGTGEGSPRRSAIYSPCAHSGVDATGSNNCRVDMVFDRPRRDDVTLSSLLTASEGVSGPSGWERQLISVSGRGKACASDNEVGAVPVVWGHAGADAVIRGGTREFEDIVPSVSVGDGDVTLGGEAPAVRLRMKDAD